jgi:hypothetical protein
MRDLSLIKWKSLLLAILMIDASALCNEELFAQEVIPGGASGYLPLQG